MTPKHLAVDPDNRLLARGPRFRLDAEVVRDNALFVSGLLVPTIGGKPVKPYQPENIWEPVAYSGSNTRFYKQDSGEALYRRIDERVYQAAPWLYLWFPTDLWARRPELVGWDLPVIFNGQRWTAARVTPR